MMNCFCFYGYQTVPLTPHRFFEHFDDDFKDLFVFSIPGVFPESPRWLLLSERTGDMNSFSERNERQRDDDSFTGQC